MSKFIDINPTLVVVSVPKLSDGQRDVAEWLVNEFGAEAVCHAFTYQPGQCPVHRAMLLNAWTDQTGNYVTVDVPDRSDRLLFVLRWGNAK